MAVVIAAKPTASQTQYTHTSCHLAPPSPTPLLPHSALSCAVPLYSVLYCTTSYPSTGSS